jgi:hypothetical protein
LAAWKYVSGPERSFQGDDLEALRGAQHGFQNSAEQAKPTERPDETLRYFILLQTIFLKLGA